MTLSGQKKLSPFVLDYESMLQDPIVDTTNRHDDKHAGERNILIERDALSVPDVGHNLLPLLSTREVGIKMRTTPKFQVEDPSSNGY